MTEMILQLKYRCHESEVWQYGLSEGDAFKGKRKIKDRWVDETCEVVCQIATEVPSYKVTDQCGQSCILY